MVRGPQFIYGENWKEYGQRAAITNDLNDAQRQCNKAIIGAISGRTASILVGIRGMDSRLSSSVDRGFNQLGSAVSGMGSQINSSMSQGFGQVGSAVNEMGSQISSSVNRGLGQIESQMNKGFNQLDSSIDNGFSQLDSHINELGSAVGVGFNQINSALIEEFTELCVRVDTVSGGISTLNASFQWGFGQILADLGGMNDTLEELTKMAKEEVQRLAFNHFEIARDAFRRGLYEECIEELTKAINGDHVSPGYKLEWRFHQLLGIVRLGFFGCNPDLINLSEAQKSFLQAAKYARSDHPCEAAKALLSAGWSAYADGRLPEALKYTDDAADLDPTLTEALFQAAKFRMASGIPAAALPLLQKAIDQDEAYIVKAAADADFQRYQDDLNAFLESMRQKQISTLTNKTNQWLHAALEWATFMHEVAACTEIIERWKMISNGNGGLLELIAYARNKMEKDYEQIMSAHAQGEKRLEAEHLAAEKAAATEIDRLKKQNQAALNEIQRLKMEQKASQSLTDELDAKRKTSVIEKRLMMIKKMVDEQIQVPEEYQETVVVTPGGLFRKKQTELITKTRMVSRSRSVVRECEEERYVRVNPFGEIISLFPNEFFKFVRIPSGNFWMGLNKDQEHYNVWDKRHLVKISRPFEMMTTPVTQELWTFVMGTNPSQFQGRDRPVENVSWDDTQDFICSLNSLIGYQSFRLPTEAEWEYACFGGDQNFLFGAGEYVVKDLQDKAWFGHNTHPVGRKKPNNYGLFDMLGNVSEWCSDYYGRYSNATDTDSRGPTVTDPVGPTFGELRVCRGGGWNDDRSYFHPQVRGRRKPAERMNDVGFRLVKIVG